MQNWKEQELVTIKQQIYDAAKGQAIQEMQVQVQKWQQNELQQIPQQMLEGVRGEAIKEAQESLEQRTELINYAKQKGVPLTFHYQALHNSAFAKSTTIAPKTERYSDTLIRMPLYPDLSNIEIDAVINCILAFYI